MVNASWTWERDERTIRTLKLAPPGPLPPSSHPPPPPRSPKTLKRAKEKEETRERGQKSRYISAVRCSRQILLPERALQRPTTQLEVSHTSTHRSETPSRKIWDLNFLNFIFSYFSSYFRPLFWSFVVVVGHQVEATRENKRLRDREW
jgi:hypothetical protein